MSFLAIVIVGIFLICFFAEIFGSGSDYTDTEKEKPDLTDYLETGIYLYALYHMDDQDDD